MDNKQQTASAKPIIMSKQVDKQWEKTVNVWEQSISDYERRLTQRLHNGHFD